VGNWSQIELTLKSCRIDWLQLTFGTVQFPVEGQPSTNPRPIMSDEVKTLVYCYSGETRA